jgi:hypothetical protein
MQLNESRMALSLNAENLDIHCDWQRERDRQRVEEAAQEFEILWQNEHPALRVLTLPEAVRQRLIDLVSDVMHPTEIDGSSAAPRQVSPPSALERLRFALLRDGPKLPGGRYVGMETAPIMPWPHQAVVARRLIATWPYSYLLCDEVGLGKTIEAGLAIRRSLSVGTRPTGPHLRPGESHNAVAARDGEQVFPALRSCPRRSARPPRLPVPRGRGALGELSLCTRPRHRFHWFS